MEKWRDTATSPSSIIWPSSVAIQVAVLYPQLGFAQVSQRGITNIVACRLSDSESEMHLIWFPLRPRMDFAVGVQSWRVQHKQVETDFYYTLTWGVGPCRSCGKPCKNKLRPHKFWVPVGLPLVSVPTCAPIVLLWVPSWREFYCMHKQACIIQHESV